MTCPFSSISSFKFILWFVCFMGAWMAPHKMLKRTQNKIEKELKIKLMKRIYGWLIKYIEKIAATNFLYMPIISNAAAFSAKLSVCHVLYTCPTFLNSCFSSHFLVSCHPIWFCYFTVFLYMHFYYVPIFSDLEYLLYLSSHFTFQSVLQQEKYFKQTLVYTDLLHTVFYPQVHLNIHSIF